MMAQKILNRDPKDEILKAFRLFDDDETGKISFKNLKRVAKELGERMTDEELQEMIDEADRDGISSANKSSQKNVFVKMIIGVMVNRLCIQVMVKSTRKSSFAS